MKNRLVLIALSSMLAACVADTGGTASSTVATVSSEAAISSESVVSSSSITPSSSSEAVSSSSAPASSSSSVAASSSSAAPTPTYEFDRAAGKVAWDNSACGSCHGLDASSSKLNNSRTYDWIVSELQKVVMPPFGTRCNNQCGKDVAAYIVYDIYKKPLPNLQKTSVDLTPVLSINVGSGDEFSVDGTFYHADNNYQGGSILATSGAIAGTGDAIHQTARTGSFTYSIPVANGFYSVELSAAELYYDNAGDRVFSISVENQILRDIDIVKVTGSHALFTTKFTHVEVTDELLDIGVSNGEGILTSITVKDSIE